MTRRIYHCDGVRVLWQGEAVSTKDAVEIAARSGADLRGANLCGANLCGADLCGADLCGADLCGADLCGADLCGAKSVSRERFMPLLMLLDQPGPIRAYKLVTADGCSPMHTAKPITYTIGKTVEADADTNADRDCGSGVNVATLDWCLANYQAGWRVFVVEFTAADIAAIPTGTDGKFRLHRCAVVGEKDITAFIAPLDQRAA